MAAYRNVIDRSSAWPATRVFVAQAVLWNVALFGVMRLAWFDRHVIGRLVEIQQTIVFWYGTLPDPKIVVDSSCSGADLMALCAGVLLAYPVAWRRRLVGATVGSGLILTLNALRIASLYAVVSTPAVLDVLHLYVWPAILTIATVAYVFFWIRWSESASPRANRAWLRFGLTATMALLAYVAVVPWAFTNPGVLRIGTWTASAAAEVLTGLGATVRASGGVLVTERGAFQVTQECLFTPTIPLYFAAVFSLPLSRRWRAAWLALALPVFFVLGVARMLSLALPVEIAASPLFLAHGFYQLITGITFIVAAALLATRHDSGLRASQRTIASIALAVVAGVTAARLWDPVLMRAAEAFATLVPSTLTSLTPPGDVQGALAIFPSFQVGLVAGLWLALTGGRRRRGLLGGLLALACLQLAFLAATGTIAARLAIEPHALVFRGWALAVPVGIAAVLAMSAEGTLVGDASYRRFWQTVGHDFPILTGAASTTYYFESEKRLISEALPSLCACVLLKTDLWDEAKNTRILQWAARQGARVYGIDLSEPIVREARDAFGGQLLRPAVSDVRRLPFCDGAFDAIYSMGTIEHFAETAASVAEMARVLKPGGRLILGVPNRHHPFMRPALVAMLSRLGLYEYGYEKSYSRRALRRMIEGAGLAVEAESGILFMPGSLRMLDLWCHTRARPLARATGVIVKLFAWLDWRVPALRRHGYLLASIAVKPGP